MTAALAAIGAALVVTVLTGASHAFSYAACCSRSRAAITAAEAILREDEGR